MQSQFSQLEAIFQHAADLSAADRRAYLDTACAHDPALRHQVESLLAEFDAGTRGVLAAAPIGSTPPITRLGEFTILRLLGEGGMGSVFEAMQTSPPRTVAIKTIRGGVATREQERRFALEAELLASLRHPGIAQVYQAGIASDETGRQHRFLAMELIRGRPLCEHANASSLPVADRIELLARVCDAVQHAHQNGVIHRDLKPGNILVEASAGSDAIGQPKVLDFGIARREQGNVSDRTSGELTQQGLLIGTLGYSSPEQADGLVIDTRSDVYSLGVVGFELFTGKLPLDVTSRPLSDAARVVREIQPPPLGTLNAACRGDLQVVIAKTLEKDPSRRYASAGELAADLRRIIRHEPILARPPTLSYQLVRFARRHRGVCASLLFAAASIVAGGIFGAQQYLRAVEAAKMAQEQRAAAEGEAARLTEALQFVHDELFSQAYANRSGRNVTMLDAMRHIDGQFDALEARDPRSACQLRQSAAHIAFGALDYAGAALQFEKAARGAAKMGDDGLPDLQSALMYAGVSLGRTGRVADGLAALDLALDVVERRKGPKIDELRIRAFRGVILAEMGRFEEAQHDLSACMRYTQQSLADTPGSWFWITMRLAHLHLLRGDPAAAVEVFEQHEAAAMGQENERAICDQLARNAAALLENDGYAAHAVQWRHRAAQWRATTGLDPALVADTWWILAEAVLRMEPYDRERAAVCIGAAGRAVARSRPGKNPAAWMQLSRVQASWEAILAIDRGDLTLAQSHAAAAAPFAAPPSTVAAAALAFSSLACRDENSPIAELQPSWSSDAQRAEPGRLVYSQVMVVSKRFDEAIAAAFAEHTSREALFGPLVHDTAPARTQVCAALAAAGMTAQLQQFVDSQWKQIATSPNRSTADSLRALSLLLEPLAQARGVDVMSQHINKVVEERMREDQSPRWAVVQLAAAAMRTLREHGRTAEASELARTMRNWLECDGHARAVWLKKFAPDPDRVGKTSH